MAETFVAVRKGPGGFEQRVCIKRMLAHLEETPEAGPMFLREAQVTARLRHANIVQVIDVSDDNEELSIVLELIEGIDMRSLIKVLREEGDSLEEDALSYIAQSLIAALEYAHGEGIVHRDISPSNVLLSTAGEVKLADFGIARARDLTRFSRTGTVKGKIPYMAPEYARTGECTPQSDLYSFGVTLYELATGLRPYRANSDIAVLHKAALGEHDPVAAHARISSSLAAIIECCIRPEPSERFEKAEAARRALRSLDSSTLARRSLAKRVKAILARAEEAAPVSSPGAALRGGTAVVSPAEQQGPSVRPAGPDEVTRTSVHHPPAPQRDVATDRSDVQPDLPRPAKIPWVWLGVIALIALCTVAFLTLR